MLWRRIKYDAYTTKLYDAINIYTSYYALKTFLNLQINIAFYLAKFVISIVSGW